MEKTERMNWTEPLFSDSDTNVYVVLDGAAIPDLLGLLDEHQPFHVCLFRGVEDPELARTAPYLIRLEDGGPFTEWVLAQLPGKHWGILAMVPERIPFIEVRKHFRAILHVLLPDGETAIFRYYDPRVCSEFLPTCDQYQLREFFGPVDRYLLHKPAQDDKQPELTEYFLDLGALQQKSW